MHLHKKVRCNKLIQEFKDTKYYYKEIRKGCGREEPWVMRKRRIQRQKRKCDLGVGGPKCPIRKAEYGAGWERGGKSAPPPSQEKVAQFGPGQLEKTKGPKVLAPTQEWVYLKGRDVFRPLNGEGKWGPTGQWWQQETQETSPRVELAHPSSTGESPGLWSDYQV